MKRTITLALAIVASLAMMPTAPASALGGLTATTACLESAVRTYDPSSAGGQIRFGSTVVTCAVRFALTMSDPTRVDAFLACLNAAPTHPSAGIACTETYVGFDISA